jgi:hypothetical protein
MCDGSRTSDSRRDFAKRGASRQPSGFVLARTGPVLSTLAQDAGRVASDDKDCLIVRGPDVPAVGSNQ